MADNNKPFNITSARAPDVENYRARDIEYLLKGHIDPRVLKVMCGLGEKNHILS